MLQLEKRVEEVAHQANSAQIQVHEVELQLQASLVSTADTGSGDIKEAERSWL